MQLSYALLPATSYPKTVGGMCYAELRAHVDRAKHLLVINQSRVRKQSSKGVQTCYPSMQLPNHRLGKVDMLSQHAKCNQAIPACMQSPNQRPGKLDTLSQHAIT